jgi:hypothetical protein
LRAFVCPFEQDRPRSDPVKTEYGKDQGVALVEPDEEAVELRSTAHLRMAAKHSAAIFEESFGERFLKNRKDWNELSGKQRGSVLPGQGQGDAIPCLGAGEKRPAQVEGKAPPS